MRKINEIFYSLQGEGYYTGSHDRNTLETAWHAAVQHAAVRGGVLPDV